MIVLTNKQKQWQKNLLNMKEKLLSKIGGFCK